MEQQKNTDSAGKNMPEKKFRAGAVSATVWSNDAVTKEGKPSTYRTVSIERNYKDKADKWQSTNSMRVTDLPKASLVLQKAYEYLVLKKHENTVTNNESEIDLEDLE